jgi:protein-tyrosine phosphatase
MIDIHAHILPRDDDGRTTFEETEAMLAIAAADGITENCRAPHANLEYRFDARGCRERGAPHVSWL